MEALKLPFVLSSTDNETKIVIPAEAGILTSFKIPDQVRDDKRKLLHFVIQGNN